MDPRWNGDHKTDEPMSPMYAGCFLIVLASVLVWVFGAMGACAMIL